MFAPRSWGPAMTRLLVLALALLLALVLLSPVIFAAMTYFGG